MRPAAIALTGLVSLIFIFAVVAYIQLILLCLAVLLCLVVASGFVWGERRRRVFSVPVIRMSHASDSTAVECAPLKIEGRAFTVGNLPPRLEFMVGYRNIHLLIAIVVIAIGSGLAAILSTDPLLSHLDPGSYRYDEIYFLCYCMAILLLPALAWHSESALMRAPGIALAGVDGQSATLWVRYQFNDPQGGYYGGTTMDFGGPKRDNLKVVFCSPRNPNLNRLSCGLLFHRVTWSTFPRQI
jgi:hypothetical protein